MKYDYSYRCSCEKVEGSARTLAQAKIELHEGMGVKKCCHVGDVDQHEKGGDLTDKSWKVFNNGKY